MSQSTQSDQSDSQERLLQHLTASHQDKHLHSEGALLTMAVITTQLDHNMKRDDGRVFPTVEDTNCTPDKTIQEGKQTTKNASPPGYTKPYTASTACVQGNVTYWGLLSLWLLVIYVQYMTIHIKYSHMLIILRCQKISCE